MGRTHQPTTKLTVAEILKLSAAQYVAKHSSQSAPQVQSTLAKLSLCRTAALGGHVYQCSGCPHEVVVHNSCGDRYCPTCSGARRRDWLDSTGELIFDGVDHFQVVFTLPEELSRLALGNRKEIYNLLFASAWSALKQTMQAEHGIDSAALMVLHTWNQKLDAHGHVHAIVPNCGPKLDGSGVGFAQRPGDPASCGRYLVDADTLRAVYRDEFLKGLDRLHCHGALKLTGEFALLLRKSDWSCWLKKLRQTTWVSYIQPPPRAGQSGEHVLKYLARYLAGGPISDGRIVSSDEQSVTFMARQGETTGGDAKQVPMTLSQVEFTRRWCLHILPSGYTRTRRYGGWSNTRRESYLESFAKQLEASSLALPAGATEFNPDDFDRFQPEATKHSEEAELDTIELKKKLCPKCSCQLIPHRLIDKPSWRRIMNSPHRPHWYLNPDQRSSK